MVKWGATKHHNGFVDRTSRKLPHLRLKSLHQTQRQPNRSVCCFPCRYCPILPGYAKLCSRGSQGGRWLQAI